MQVRLLGCRFQPPSKEMQTSKQFKRHTRQKGLESARTADAFADDGVDAYFDAYIDAQAHGRTAHHHGDDQVLTFLSGE